MASTIKIKRGLKTNLPILSRGELGYATDTNELFIGVLAEPTQVSDNVLVSDLGALDNYFDKSEIEGLISTGLVWNDDEGVFSISIDFATGSEILDDEVNDKVMSPSTTAAMIDDRVGTTLTTGEYITESDLSEAIGALPGTGLDLEDGTLNVNTGTIFASPTFTGTVTIAAEGSLTGVPTPTNNADAANKSYVDGLLAANDAMVFKGTLGSGGTFTSLPTTHDVGWTIKVITAGTYAGKVAEIGDMYISLVSRSGEDNVDADWAVVQANIDGAVVGPSSSVDNRVASFDGVTGKLIKDSGFTIETSVPSGALFTDTLPNDGTLTVEGTTGLTGSGTFTANQASNATITITPVIATKEEAEDGNNSEKLMTPERVKQAIEVLSPAPTIATEQQAIEGTDNETFMTPLRTAQATAILDGGSWVTPVVNFTEIGATNVKFTITNEEDFEVTVKYEVGDDTSGLDESVVLAANATSDEIEIGDLAEGTSYILFAQSFVGIDAISVIVEYSFTTPDDPKNSPGSLFFLEGAFAKPSEGFEELGPVGFFGVVSAEEFLGTDDWNDVMSELGISQGTAQFASGQDISPVLKFRHNNKIKFITQKTIRHSVSWDHIHSALSDGSGNGVYGGKEIEINGITYRARLMRGWGQVSANTDGTGTPNYETGPLYTISFDFGTGGNNGANWPTNTSGWSANNPNEWNTLIFPVASATQSQTSGVPDWASYSNADLSVASGDGRMTWTQETWNDNTFGCMIRGRSALAYVRADAYSDSFSELGLRLVFELEIPGATKFFPAEVNN